MRLACRPPSRAAATSHARTSLLLPNDLARSDAFFPSSSLISTSAFISTSSFTSSVCPLDSAQCKGVLMLLDCVLMSGVTPSFAKRILLHSCAPFSSGASAAQCKPRNKPHTHTHG